MHHLAHHDKIPYVNERGRRIMPQLRERKEQVFAAKYVHEDACVLELGARYGMVSNVLSSVLKNPRWHAAVEPDLAVLEALTTNRNRHNGQYVICPFVITETRQHLVLKGAGYGRRVRAAEPRAAEPRISTMTLAALERYIGHDFDCLIADCEGCLPAFLAEYPKLLARLHTVILEKDQPQTCNYADLEARLHNAGLVEVVKGFRAVYIRLPILRILRGVTGWGCVGVAGFLGYETKGQHKAPNSLGRQIISAHAPSTIHIFTPMALRITAGLLPSAHSAMTFFVDGASVGSRPVHVRVGTHALEIRTTSAHNAHSLWRYEVWVE